MSSYMNATQIKDSLWQLFKKLPYDDGPSTTRWVFVTSALTICLGALAMFLTFCAVYWHKGEANLVFAGLIGTTTTALIGFAANSLNLKHTLIANQISQVAGKDNAGVVADTPITTQAVNDQPK